MYSWGAAFTVSKKFNNTYLSLSLSFPLTSLSPELLEPMESLSPLEPQSLPGPWCLPQTRLTRVGELSLEVVSGALLSIAAMPVKDKWSKAADEKFSDYFLRPLVKRVYQNIDFLISQSKT